MAIYCINFYFNLPTVISPCASSAQVDTATSAAARNVQERSSLVGVQGCSMEGSEFDEHSAESARLQCGRK